MISTVSLKGGLNKFGAQTIARLREVIPVTRNDSCNKLYISIWFYECYLHGAVTVC